MRTKLFFFLLLGILFSQDCTAVQSLYDNALYLDANEKIKSLDISNNNDFVQSPEKASEAIQVIDAIFESIKEKVAIKI